MKIVKEVSNGPMYVSVGLDAKLDDRAIYRIGYHEDRKFVYHNLHGPAFSCVYGCLYYVHDKDATTEAEEWLYERNIDINNMSEEDKLAFKFFMLSFKD